MGRLEEEQISGTKIRYFVVLLRYKEYLEVKVL